MSPYYSASELLERAEEAFGKREYGNALGLFKQMLYLVSREDASPHRERRKADVLLRIVDSLALDGNWFEALMYVDTVVVIAQSWEDIGLEIGVNMKAVKILIERGGWRDAKKRLGKIRDLVRRPEGIEDRGEWSYHMATAEWRLGNTAEGEEFSRRALQTAREAEDPLLEARCLILMAHISSGIGDLEHARDLFQEALGILEEEGDVTELPRILNGQGDVCKIQGHYGMAMLQYEKCIASAKELGNYRYQARGLINSAECMAKEGSLQEARKRMEGAHDLLAGKGNLYSMASIEFVWGIIAFKEGNQEVMDGHFTSAINKMEELETPYELGLFAYEYAQALRETGRKEEAKIMYMKAGEAFERTGASELLMKTKKAAAEMAS